MARVVVALAFAGLGAAQNLVPAALPKKWNTIRKGEAFVPMTAEERERFLLRRVFLRPGAPLRAAFQAALDQRANKPAAWGQGFDAYGQRFLSRWGQSAIRNGIESATAAALGYEQRYIQCNCDGVMRRTGHALAMNFITYNHDGHWVPNLPRMGSTIAAGYIRLSWLPPGEKTALQATRGLGLQFATGSLTNVWREFSPPLVRRVKHKFGR